MGHGYETGHLAGRGSPSHRREPSRCGEAVPSSQQAPAQTLRALFTLAWAAGTGGPLQGAAGGTARGPTWRPQRKLGQSLCGAGGGVHGGASSPAAHRGSGTAAHGANPPEGQGPLSCLAGGNDTSLRPRGRHYRSKGPGSLFQSSPSPQEAGRLEV